MPGVQQAAPQPDIPLAGDVVACLEADVVGEAAVTAVADGITDILGAILQGNLQIPAGTIAGDQVVDQPPGADAGGGAAALPVEEVIQAVHYDPSGLGRPEDEAVTQVGLGRVDAAGGGGLEQLGAPRPGPAAVDLADQAAKQAPSLFTVRRTVFQAVVPGQLFDLVGCTAGNGGKVLTAARCRGNVGVEAVLRGPGQRLTAVQTGIKLPGLADLPRL